MGYRNLLALDVVSAQGTAAVARRGGLRVAGTVVGGARAAEGQEVTVAIRPEDVRVAGPGDQQVAEAVAEVVEYHGRVLHVEAVTREGDRIHLRVHDQVRPGDALAVAVDADRALFFAKEQAVSGGSGGAEAAS
jgi:putative spermidine/putrescine transport system ATP-binding protein